MKRLMRSLLLAAVLCTVLCVGALAADTSPTVDGVYNLTCSALKPLDANGAEVTKAAAHIDGAAVADFYAGAVKFSVEVSGLTNGEQYLLLAVKDNANGALTGDSIVYIDQAAAVDGKVSFTAYPSALPKGTYTVYLTGGGRTITNGAKVGSFTSYQSYTLGDVDGNEMITTNDAVMILKHCVGLEELEPGSPAYLAANVDGNGAITTNDAVEILKYVAGIIQSFD